MSGKFENHHTSVIAYMKTIASSSLNSIQRKKILHHTTKNTMKFNISNASKYAAKIPSNKK